MELNVYKYNFDSTCYMSALKQTGMMHLRTFGLNFKDLCCNFFSRSDLTYSKVCRVIWLSQKKHKKTASFHFQHNSTLTTYHPLLGDHALVSKVSCSLTRRGVQSPALPCLIVSLGRTLNPHFVPIYSLGCDCTYKCYIHIYNKKHCTSVNGLTRNTL